MLHPILPRRAPTLFLRHLGNALPRSRLIHSTPPPLPKPASRTRKWGKRALYFTAGIGSIYALDKMLNASSITRNLRTLWTCALIAADYKLNFTQEKSSSIPLLHDRVGRRVYHLLTSNGGLYIKLGQAIGANAPLLPKPIQAQFAQLFDNAPQVPLSQIHEVFKSQFGQSPHEIFEEFQEEAVASASIAQVHKAKLRGLDEEGRERWVAVKVQKPDVRKQMEWDLMAYRVVMWIFENWVFDLPVYFTVDFLSDHLRRELDFLQESRNAQQTAAFVASEPRLRDKVYIPKVYPEFTTQQVLTAEWIDGVRFSDRQGLFALMGETDPRAQHSSTPSHPPDEIPPSLHHLTPKPLKGGVQSIMSTMVSLFSAQIFSWGWVHCDPHPGNIIIRPSPSSPREAQLVLIDHGLYVRLSPQFRREYAELWRGMLRADFGEVERVSRGWGFGSPELFASATLMRPVRLRGKKEKEGRRGQEEGGEGEGESQYEASVRMKRMLKKFLTDTDRMPKELMFLGRNMRMVQGNNQMLGSPVNRIKITGFWASRSLASSPSPSSSPTLLILTLPALLKSYTQHLIFRTVMFTLDIAFWVTRLRQWVAVKTGGRVGRGLGFEDRLEEKMRKFAKGSFGVDVQEGFFEG